MTGLGGAQMWGEGDGRSSLRPTFCLWLVGTFTLQRTLVDLQFLLVSIILNILIKTFFFL